MLKIIKFAELFIDRSSRPEVICRNFSTFVGKHLSQSIFFNKVAGLKPATLLKKRLWDRCFPVYFAKFLRIPSFTEHFALIFEFKNQNNIFGH